MPGDRETLHRHTVREHRAVPYWIVFADTGSQRKGLHLPTSDSTRDDPVTRCRFGDAIDGEPRAKDLETYPPGYAPDRICTECVRALAREYQLDLGGELRVE